MSGTTHEADDTNGIDKLQNAFKQMLWDLHTESDSWTPEGVKGGDIHVYTPESVEQVRGLCESAVNELEIGAFKNVAYTLDEVSDHLVVITDIREEVEVSEMLTNDLGIHLREVLEANEWQNEGVEVDQRHCELWVHHVENHVAEQLKKSVDAYMLVAGDAAGAAVEYDAVIGEYPADRTDDLPLQQLRVENIAYDFDN